MAVIRIKRSTGTSAPGALKTAEIAYAMGSGTQANSGDRLFFGKGDDGSGNATSIVVVGGEYFTSMLDHVHGTLTASSAIIVDASSKIDVLNVDNVTIDGNTISTTDTNGNLTLSPNGSGTVDVATSKITSVVDPTSDQDAATKKYVDDQFAGGSVIFTVAGDAGSPDTVAGQETITFSGDSDILTTVSANTVTFTHRASSVTAGTYGSQSAIPVFTVNENGHIDSAGTVSVATTLNVTAEDASTAAVSLLTQGLTITGGEGIDTTASGQTVTISGEDATDTNKGIASFNSTHFTVSSGAVSANDLTFASDSAGAGTAAATIGETFTFDGRGPIRTFGSNSTISIDVVDAQADGSTKGVATFNSTNFSASGGIITSNDITLGSTSLTLGETVTDIAGLTSLTIDNIKIDGNTISSTDGSNTMYIDPAPEDSDGGDLIIRGNLFVQGTQTVVNSTTVSVNDLNLTLADSAANAAAADGAGLTIGGGLYSGTKATLTFNGANDEWEMNKTLNMTGSTSLKFAGVDWKEVMEDHLAGNTFLEGEGLDITYDDVSNTITFAAELASASNLGVASFNSSDFSVSSGAVSLATIDGGTF